jgi:hypothetical protein
MYDMPPVAYPPPPVPEGFAQRPLADMILAVMRAARAEQRRILMLPISPPGGAVEARGRPLTPPEIAGDDPAAREKKNAWAPWDCCTCGGGFLAQRESYGGL